MPPAGVRKGSKDARKYEHVKESLEDQGKPEKAAKEIASRTVNKDRAREGKTQQASKSSTQDPKSSSQRGGERSGTDKEKGRTRDQLYNEAKQKNVEGRSSMSKHQLQKAVDAEK